jgi:hypothetical protein
MTEASPRHASEHILRWASALFAGLGILSAFLVCDICLAETPAAIHSFCGTCRGFARESFIYTGALAGWGVLATCYLRPHDGIGIRLFRMATLVSLTFWCVTFGFVQGWW